MRVDVIRGTDEIGGSVIEVEGGGARILLDAGAELPGTAPERSHPIDFDKLLEERDYDAIFVTHYHGDHLGLLEGTDHRLPPIYMGGLAYRLYGIACDYRGAVAPFAPSGELEDGVPIEVGGLTVTPILCDHSAADSYSIVVRDGDETLLYTGDFRSSGRKSFPDYLARLPEHVDTLIVEGTTVGRERARTPSERDLEDRMTEVMRTCRNEVFVLLSPLNVDRVATVYGAAARSGRLMLMDPYMAAVTTECSESGLHVPNPSLDNVGVYLYQGVERAERDRLRELYADGFLGRRQYADRRYAMCVRASVPMRRNLEAIDRLTPLEGSVLVYSLWEGYRRSSSMAHFLSGVRALGVEVVPVHTSGHADVETIRAVVERANAEQVIPVHTESPGWFESSYPGRCVRR